METKIFSQEDIEKLAEEYLDGGSEEFPEDDQIEIPFPKLLLAMAVYMVGISRWMDRIDQRIANIELALADESGLGKA